MFPKIISKSCTTLNFERESPNLKSLKNQILISPSFISTNTSFYNSNSSNHNINISSRDFNYYFYNNKGQWIQNQFDNNNTNTSGLKGAKLETSNTDGIARQDIKAEDDQKQQRSIHRRKRVTIKSLEFNQSSIFRNSQQYEKSIQNNSQNTQQPLNIVKNVESINRSRPVKRKIISINVNDQQQQDTFQLEQNNQSENLIPHQLPENSGSAGSRKICSQGFAFSTSNNQKPLIQSYSSQPLIQPLNSDLVRQRKNYSQDFAVTTINNEKPLIQNNSQQLIQPLKLMSLCSVFSNRSNNSKQTQCSHSYIPSDSEKNISESLLFIPCSEEDNQIRSSELIKKQSDKPLIQNLVLENNALQGNRSPFQTPEEIENFKQESQKNSSSKEESYNFINFFYDSKKCKKSINLKGILKYSSLLEINEKPIRSIKQKVSFSKIKEYF